MSTDNRWKGFAHAGDEWLMTYACVTAYSLASVELFAIGHAAELYLKAVVTKLTGDANKAIKLGHNLKRLWEECKALDANFMPGHEMKESCYMPVPDGVDLAKTTPEEDCHRLEHRPWYTVAEGLADWKYFWTPPKSPNPKEQVFTFQGFDEYWIDYFKNIRIYLKYPGDDSHDPIKWRINHKYSPLDPRAAHYLRKLYQ